MPVNKKDYTKISALLAAIGVVLLSSSFFFLAKEVIDLQELRTRENIRELVQGDFKVIISKLQFLLEKVWTEEKGNFPSGKKKGEFTKLFFKVTAGGTFIDPPFPKFPPLPVVSKERRAWLEKVISTARNLILEGKKEEAYSKLNEALKNCESSTEKAILNFEVARVGEKVLPIPLICDLLAEIIEKNPGVIGLDGVPLAPLASMRLAALLKKEGSLNEERRVLKLLLLKMASGAWEMDSFTESYLFKRALEEWGDPPPKEVLERARIVLLVRRFILPKAGMEEVGKAGEKEEISPVNWILKKIKDEILISGYKKIVTKDFVGIEGVIIDNNNFIKALRQSAFRLISSGGGFLLKSAEGGDIIAKDGKILKNGISFEGAISSPGLPVVLTVFRPLPTISRSERLIPWAGFLLIVIALGGGSLLGIRSLQHEIRLARMQREFVDNISHELRTPITSILLNAELLSRSGLNKKVMESALKHIVEEGHRLERMVSDILDISRFSRAGTSWINPQKVHPVEILEKVLNSYLPILNKKGFRIETKVEDELPYVEADVEALTRAIGNLLSNAAKYSGSSKDIHIVLKKEGNKVLFMVIDHGIGVPKGEEEKIFERFYRAQGKARKVSGVGLGLAVAREIARALKGDIYCRETKGGGATFILELPAKGAV